MHRRLTCLCLAVAAMSCAILRAGENELLLDKEKVHALIREAAAKIEEKYKASRPEADGLAQRVEQVLSTPAPPPPADRPQKLAVKLLLMSNEGSFHSGIRGISGAVFDNTPTGFAQQYQDLESTSARDAAEVWRWLKMADAARVLKWQDKKELCTQRAVGAARALVSREPKNAEAHALLALSLEWGAEKLAELQTALRLDPRQPVALNEMLDHRIAQGLEAAATRQGTRLEEKSRDVTQALFDHPLNEEEAVAYERQLIDMEHELKKLFSLAQERGDLWTHLNNIVLQSSLAQNRDLVAAAADRPPDEDLEKFRDRMKNLLMKHLFSLLSDEKLLTPSLKLADGDPEATGAIVLMAILGDGMNAKAEGRPPSEEVRNICRPAIDRLAEMAAATSTVRAARAAEAVLLADLSRCFLLEEPPKKVDQLMRAIHLDPFRPRTQTILMLLCSGELSKDRDVPAVTALSMTELALLPDLTRRRACAAWLARVGDWPAAHHLLDTCLRDHPDHIGLLNQKASTLLRENQSKASQKKAAVYFNKIEAVLDKPDASPDPSELTPLARNHILFLMIGGKNDEAREELAKAGDNGILDAEECQKLEKLLP
ncbi:hypothetical protein [Prosthecobacter sp.]|uniref:hypothetical protein n=1 Tax=Prosthecobacter sp. TaxID=1965333 RepID=UPI00378360AD